MRGRQQRPVQQGFEAVVFQYRRTSHLPHEAAAKRTFDSPTCLIGAEAEKKGRADVQALKELRKSRYALEGTPVGIHVDFECDSGGHDDGNALDQLKTRG